MKKKLGFRAPVKIKKPGLFSFQFKIMMLSEKETRFMEPRDSAPIIKIYQQAIIKTLSEAIPTNIFPETLQIVQIFDRHSNRYQLLCQGWVDEERVFHPVIHVEIINDKVWIQHNESDIDIGEELSNNGIPKSQMVLGLHPPSIRELNPTYAYE